MTSPRPDTPLAAPSGSSTATATSPMPANPANQNTAAPAAQPTPTSQANRSKNSVPGSSEGTAEQRPGIPVGPVLKAILHDALDADIPVLLEGLSGIGKSEIFDEVCMERGIELTVLDLSIMEPIDIAGMPRIEQNRTCYAAPSFWPEAGPGVVLFEELNRALRYVRAPCLQILTRRALNEHQLPAGVLPCACINPADDSEHSYHVDELDPALLARFMRLPVVACTTSWCLWAKQNGVHPAVVDYVERCPDTFQNAAANPRAWTQVSRVLTTWEHKYAHDDPFSVRNSPLAEQLEWEVKGLVGNEAGVSFLTVYYGPQDRPSVEQIVERYDDVRSQVQSWLESCRLDLQISLLEELKRFLTSQGYQHIATSKNRKSNVESFFSDLVPDLKKALRQWLKEQEFSLVVPSRPRRRKR